METASRNQIGNGTVVKGDIDSNGDIRVDGQLIGNLKSNGKIIVGSTGTVEGEIVCKQAEISGVVKGKIKTDDLTSLKASSRVEVELTTKQLQIEVGAQFTGHCIMQR